MKSTEPAAAFRAKHNSRATTCETRELLSASPAPQHSVAQSAIVESTLKKHNYLTRTRYPQRKSAHEDCCGYCERYCENKLSPQRHHDIVVWREEVNTSRRQPKRQPRREPDKMTTSINLKRGTRLKFLKHAPEEEDGVLVYTPRRGTSGLSSRTRSTRANTTRTDGDLASEFASMTLAPASDVTPQPSDVIPTVNGKVVAGYDDGRYTPAVKEVKPQTDVSDRTMSNQLLNVLTIDDAMRQHRYNLISNQPKISPAGYHDNPDQPAIENGDDLEIQKVSSAKFIDHPYNGRIVTADATTRHSVTSKHVRDELGQDKYQKIIPVDGNGDPVRSVKQVLYPESSATPALTSNTCASTLAEGPTDYVMRAVDQAWETSRPANVKHGRYTYLKHGADVHASVNSKPESKRFQRMNKNLHKLMETSYLPNNKLSIKLKTLRCQSAGVDTNKEQRDVTKTRAMTTMSLPGSRQNTRAKFHDPRGVQTPSSLSGKENFLEMIMDMDEKV